MRVQDAYTPLDCQPVLLYHPCMTPEEANKRIQQQLAAQNQGGSWSGEGTKYGIPDGSRDRISCFGSGFVPDGNGATLELLALLLRGDRTAVYPISAANNGMGFSVPIPPNTTVILPQGFEVPTWDDPYPLDIFGRTYLQYWVGRALEAAYNAPGSVMGVMATGVCELGKDGKPGQCCNPTDDPFPSKPYFYVVPFGKSATDVGKDFGRDENGWIELRRANADDPDGFIKQENKWCYWKVWKPGKRLRIPGSWPEAKFTDAVLPHLVDGNGYKLDLQRYFGSASLFFKGFVWRWGSPIHMMIECGRELWKNPSVVPGLDVDPLIGKEIIKRTFMMK